MFSQFLRYHSQTYSVSLQISVWPCYIFCVGYVISRFVRSLCPHSSVLWHWHGRVKLYNFPCANKRPRTTWHEQHFMWPFQMNEIGLFLRCLMCPLSLILRLILCHQYLISAECSQLQCVHSMHSLKAKGLSETITYLLFRKPCLYICYLPWKFTLVEATIYVLISFKKCDIYFPIISIFNTSLLFEWMTRTYIPYTVNTVVADGLRMQGVRVLTAMALT